MSARETLKAIHDRGDLLPWLEGKTEIYAADTGEKIDSPGFGGWGPDVFAFRPIPEPQYRPWTREELWLQRECWFRHKTTRVIWRASAVDTNPSRLVTLGYNNEWHGSCELLADYEYLDPTTGEWLPCGVLESPQ